MRAFVAITFDEALRRKIAETQTALKRADADVRWVEFENLHLTLKFLGDVADEPVARLTGLLKTEASRFTPLTIDLGTVGAFPRSGSPRILWAGVRGEVQKLLGLADGIERAALTVGVPREDRPFSPHLTIGRVKSERNKSRLRNALESRADDVFGKHPVTEFVLYRSTLTPEGPIYDVIEKFPLGA